MMFPQMLHSEANGAVEVLQLRVIALSIFTPMLTC